jgi:superfamily I DNA and/or RNA helicase
MASGLREPVRKSELIKRRLTNQHDWISKRVGTVYTFQGKQAEAVIFVLGAPLPARTGTRNWAGDLANLLNVAISRA